MARRTKNNKTNDAAGAALFVIILVVVLLAIITPIVAIFGYFYNKIKFDKINKKISGNMSDFWLDDEEKELFLSNTEYYFEVSEKIETAKSRGHRANLSINKDGSFSARSRLGKEIKSILGEYQPVKEKLQDDIYELTMLPIQRWNEFSDYVRNKNAFMISLLCWITTVGYFYIQLEMKSLSDIYYAYLDAIPMFFSLIFSDNSNDYSDISMVMFSAIFTVIAFFLARMIFKNTGKKYSPKPEKVSLDNINDY